MLELFVFNLLLLSIFLKKYYNLKMNDFSMDSVIIEILINDQREGSTLQEIEGLF